MVDLRASNILKSVGPFALSRVAVLALGVVIGGCSDSSADDAAEGNPSMPAAGSTSGPNGTGGSANTGGAKATGGAGNSDTGGQSTSGGMTSPGGSGNTSTGGAATPVAPGTNLTVPAFGQVLQSQALAQQLVVYDPGSLLRCDVSEDAAYQATIDELGGVSWGYNVSILEDQSKPRYLAGVELPPVPVPNAAAGDGGGVEIVNPDVVAVTDAAALYYSKSHGVMVVGLEGDRPEFHCATQLPGRVDQFFFHQGHLVVMTTSQNGHTSYLLHFDVEGTEMSFVEAIRLGDVQVLDSRRFNQKLVFYTSFNPNDGATPDPSGGIAPPPVSQGQHRALRVFELGDTLKEELYDTLIDTSPNENQLRQGIEPGTAPGTQVSEWRNFGYSMWASDHYFVVTEQISKSFIESWVSRTYSVCTASHTVETPYNYCWTEYETRPNPDYVEPDNSGGDRSCQGTTLSDCLVEVARVANKTIQVPVGRKCEERTHVNWICDAAESKTTEYAELRHESSTQLFIYEYTDEGFVRVDSKVHEVTNTGLAAVDPNSTVDVITTSAESFDLAVPGQIQTLYFQNGYLYVISQGVLQVYAMGGSSIVRTSTLQVVNESLQSSLFSADQLFLSDFGWRGGDHSTLRVINLSNPAFPTQDGATHQLPGGHRSIIAADAGIFTIGTVQQFMGQTVNALKLGLFSDPYAEETAYLILGTDLQYNRLLDEKSQYWNGAKQRLLLPYTGQNEAGFPVQRVGVSRVVAGAVESEGAVVLPEPAERVRPLLSDEESYLTFAKSSIAWLTPEAEEWKAEPVLEYFEPFALYHPADGDETVEFQALGTRCRLYFTDDAAINQRADGVYSEEFACRGYPLAYGRRFVFADTGYEFGADHSLRPLTADEVTETRELIAARLYCLLELELVQRAWLDPDMLPPPEEFTCLTPMEYSELSAELQRRP